MDTALEDPEPAGSEEIGKPDNLARKTWHYSWFSFGWIQNRGPPFSFSTEKGPDTSYEKDLQVPGGTG
jgi:hypothetical protein